jgi:hypothetical protein
VPDGVRGHPAASAVRAAMTYYARPGDEPPALDRLADRIEQTWEKWQAPSPWRYAQVGQDLPDLIRDVQRGVRLHRDEDRRRALRQASKLYQLVRTWTKRVGEHELSWSAADRAVNTALEADDPDLAGAAAWNLAMILSAKGHTEHARSIVYQAIEELTPFMSDAAAPRLAVWGGLHLMGATEAARDDKADEAQHLLDTAAPVAARVGETNHFRMAFGPSNVAVHRVSTYVELGRTRDALDIAERVSLTDVPVVERRLTYHQEAARCHARKRNDIAAVHMIQHIHRESPEELHHNVLVRETLRELMRRARPAIQADLRPLLTAAGLPD